jgi:hypothetical protein
MNPFIWFLQKELFVIHEYIADNSAVDKGNTALFAKMILRTFHLQKASGPQQFFFNSSIKRRLIMISNEQYTSRKLLRKLLIFPMTILFGSAVIFISGNSQSLPARFNKQQLVVSAKDNRDAFIDDSTYADVTYVNVNGKLATVKQNVFYSINTKNNTAFSHSIAANISYTRANGTVGAIKGLVKYSSSLPNKQ